MQPASFCFQEAENKASYHLSQTARHAEARGDQDQDTLYMRPEVSRQGNYEPERLQYITQDVRDVASASNQVRRASRS